MTRRLQHRLQQAMIGACALFVAGRDLSAQQHVVRPLAIEEAIAIHSFEPTAAIRVSHDGRYVAYTLTNPARVRPREMRHDFFSASGVPLEMEGCDVWVVDTRTGVMKSVSGAKGSSWGPTWSPNGRLLAFYSDRGGLVHLWVWNAITNQLRRPSDVVAHEQSGLDPARWLPDGSGLVVKINPEGVPLTEAFPSSGADTARMTVDTGVTAVVYRSLPIEATDTAGDTVRATITPRTAASGLVSDLAVVQLATGSVRRIVRHQPISMYDVSPNGKYVAYSIFIGTDKASQQLHFDLAIASIASGRSHFVARHLPQAYGRNMSWSPDGEHLAYILSSYGTLSNNPRTSGGCFVVPATGGEPLRVTPDVHPIFDGALRRPIWSARGDRLILYTADGVWSVSPAGGALHEIGAVPSRRIRLIVQADEEGPAWSPDSGRSIYVTTFDTATKRVGFAKINVASGNVRQLIEEARTYSWLPFGFTAEGGNIYYVSEDARRAQDIWRGGANLQDRHPLTHVNPQLDQYTFGEQRLVHWLGNDGTPLMGALLLPADYQPGHAYPLVVNVYGGGTFSNDVFEFGLNPFVLTNLQLLATRGFAVLLPDTPLRLGTPMRDLAGTVLPGVNRVIEMGIADPERLAVIGASYGGYSTLALVTQTTRFKAAVSTAGFSDIPAFYSSLNPADRSVAIGWAENGQGRMGGSPWQYRDRYIENSPFFYLDRVETPLLIVHGGLDRGVPPFLGEQSFVALRRLGKEVTYVNYAGENHGILGARNARDYTKRVISWLQEHLPPPRSR